MPNGGKGSKGTLRAEPGQAEGALALALARAQVAELQAEALGVELARQEAIAKGFLDRVNHELRTPLNVVLGFASLARDGAFGPTEAPMNEALDKILEAAERLTGLLGDLLDARRMEEGLPPLDLAPLDPGPWLAAVAQAFGPVLAAKGQALKLELAPGLPTSILADGRRLQGALVAILDNASKFSPPGAELRLQAEAGPEGGLRLRVEDRGIGIPEAALPRVFERFFQADGSTTRQHGGTGLGLALAKAAVDAHGGRLSAGPTPGGGTTLSLELPAQPQAAWVG